MQCSDSFQKKESDIRQKDCLDVYVIFVDNMLYNPIKTEVCRKVEQELQRKKKEKVISHCNC